MLGTFLDKAVIRFHLQTGPEDRKFYSDQKLTRSMQATMRPLVCTAKPPPITPRDHSQLDHHTPVLPNQSLTPKARKLRASSKGFSGMPPSVGKGTAPTRREETNGNFNGGGGEGDRVPRVVLERMLVRIAVLVLVPMVAGIALLHIFGVMKQQSLWEAPVWVVVSSTFLCFGASALGVAYGGLSTSWDPDRKGSVLGLEEAHKNWADLWIEDDER